MRSFTALLLSLALVGCGSSRFTSGLELQPQGEAAVQALGPNPFVIISNDGPGTVEVQFPNQAGEPLGRASRGQTLLGGGTTYVRTADEPASIRVEVLHASGVAIDSPG